MTLADAPRDPSLLFFPGGTTGAVKVMSSDSTVAFIADQSALRPQLKIRDLPPAEHA